MIADLATFRILFDEFADVQNATVTVWLDDSAELLCEGSWGTCYPKAVLYYTAHQLALSENRKADAVSSGSNVQTTTTSGVITSASDGRLSTSFAEGNKNGNEKDLWLDRTAYGQAYNALRRQCLNGARISSARPIVNLGIVI